MDALISVVKVLAVVIGGVLVAGWVFVALVTRGLWRKALEASTSPLTVEPLDLPLPDRLATTLDELRELGYEPVVERIAHVAGYGTTVAQVLSRSADGSTVADAVCGFRDREPDPLVGFFSPLAGRRGMLTTESHRTHPAPDEELVQVLVGASPAELHEAHAAALALLDRCGVAGDPVGTSAPELEDLSAWAHEVAGRLFVDRPELAKVRFEHHARTQTHEGMGPLPEHDDLSARVEALGGDPTMLD